MLCEDTLRLGSILVQLAPEEPEVHGRGPDGTYFALFTKCVRGTVSQRSDRAFGGAWLFGARVGIGAESPIGPFRLEYGLSTTGRRQWLARIGRWI